MITTTLGMLFVILAFCVAFIHGMVWRFFAFWQRGSLYVKNDEYRIGIFAASIVFVMFFLRLAESYAIYHKPLNEGFWPLAWSLVYCWGITSGFRHTRNVRVDIPRVKQIADE